MRLAARVRHAALASLVVAAAVVDPSAQTAQTRRPAPKRPAPPPPPALETIAPEVECPTPLGPGVRTKRLYCDVMSGNIPASGVIVRLPPHQGPVTLSFDLHNRHTYSEEQVKANRAYARYTAVIGVLTADNTLLGRAAVQSEFRRPADLVDRIGGGAGPSGVKAVAPTGTERITMTVPEEEHLVSLLGEKLIVERTDGSATYSTTGRPIAVVSNIEIEYRPPPKPTATKAKPR